jgi:hypothetical protein
MTKPAKPGWADLERVTEHFLHYLSNAPGPDGISPRCRFYGTLPVEARKLFPDIGDDVILDCVRTMMDQTRVPAESFGITVDITLGHASTP